MESGRDTRRDPAGRAAPFLPLFPSPFFFFSEEASQFRSAPWKTRRCKRSIPPLSFFPLLLRPHRREKPSGDLTKYLGARPFHLLFLFSRPLVVRMSPSTEIAFTFFRGPDADGGIGEDEYQKRRHVRRIIRRLSFSFSSPPFAVFRRRVARHDRLRASSSFPPPPFIFFFGRFETKKGEWGRRKEPPLPPSSLLFSSTKRDGDGKDPHAPPPSLSPGQIVRLVG